MQGAPPLTYQWTFDGKDIAGATGPSVAISDFQLSQNGRYAVTVSNGLGSVERSFGLNAVYEPTIRGLVDETFNPSLILPTFSSTSGYGNLFLSAPSAAAIQPDGKVLLAVPSLVRLNQDGSPDVPFDTAAGLSDEITSIYVQPDGRILVSTYDEGGLIGRGPSVGTYRRNSDGTLDPTYTPDIRAGGCASETADAVPRIMLQDGRYLAPHQGFTARLTRRTWRD